MPALRQETSRVTTPVHVADDVIPAVWIAFWLYWLLASRGVKASRTRSMSTAPIRVGIVLLALAIIRAGVFRGHQGTTENPWLQGIGLVVFLSGLALAVWARIYLGRNWGMPMSEKVDPELVTTGPYRYVRHPIYSGIILASIGTTIAISVYWLLAVGALSAYFIYSARIEERNMARLFPDRYPAYRRSTKMLIPFVF